MQHPTAKKTHMELGTIALILVGCLFLAGLTGCGGGNRYQVDYGGQKDCYTNAKDSYRAGTKVTLYFDLIATDTDYSFLLNGESIKFTYDDKKGFVIQFTMPDHDVKLECNSVNSMVSVDSWTGMGNPLSESDLTELEEETGYVMVLPEEEFLDLTVTRMNGDSPFFSLDFVWSGDGKAYTFRLLCPQEELEDADISGMYYAWTGEDIPEDGSYKAYWNEDGVGICLWQDAHAVFSIAVTESAERDVLVNMHELLSGSCVYPDR